jgi:hypothetical protein
MNVKSRLMMIPHLRAPVPYSVHTASAAFSGVKFIPQLVDQFMLVNKLCQEAV